MRVHFYVDGFNLYFGLKRFKGCKWLNLEALCELLSPADEIGRIRYFTANVKGRINPESPGRQQTYLRALRSTPKVEITKGYFRIDKRWYPLVEPVEGNEWARVWKPKEKGSDVNLGAYLLLDAFNQEYDRAIVISNDSDLREPIRLVRNPPFGLPVWVFNPHPPGSRAKMGATKHAEITRDQFRASQFPESLIVGRRPVTRPEAWA
jgi:NYN domain